MLKVTDGVLALSVRDCVRASWGKIFRVWSEAANSVDNSKRALEVSHFLRQDRRWTGRPCALTGKGTRGHLVYTRAIR